MIGSLASCCSWFRGDPDKATRLTKDERLKTKSVLTGLDKMDAAAREAFPLALLGFAGWTLIWLYRGLRYPSVRGKVSLHKYVDKSFLIAKTFGVATFLAALMYTVREREENVETEENGKAKENGKATENGKAKENGHDKAKENGKTKDDPLAKEKADAKEKIEDLEKKVGQEKKAAQAKLDAEEKKLSQEMKAAKEKLDS